MPNFITKNQLIKTSIKDEDLNLIKLSNIFEKFSMSLTNKIDYEASIFLSHSHKDKDLVYLLFSIFKKLNVKVYVDWLDDNLTYPPTGETAKKIKQMIKENKKFIFLATNDAISSKWCNWELGLGDVHRYKENIALFPVADNSGNWIGNEYLQIYPFIDKSYKTLIMDNEYRVIYPDGKNLDLTSWLKS